jgi:choline dehydrogenase-like flavoprotein
LVPYFKKTQSHTPQDNDLLPGTGTVTSYQGTGGPIKVYFISFYRHIPSYDIFQTSYNTWYSSLITPFVKSLSELSFKLNNNPNGGDPIGFSNLSRCVDNETATRQHAGVTYLRQAAGRENISVLVGARATKIVFAEGGDELVATAVEFDVNGVRYVVKASKEIVLSAGKFYSAGYFVQDLILSSTISKVPT